MIALFPLTIPGFCFYFYNGYFVIGIPFIIAISNEKNPGDLFTHSQRSGFLFALDYFSITWKGDLVFYFNYFDRLFGEERYIIVESTMGANEKLYTYDGVWEGYRAMVARKRKRLPFRQERRPAFILTTLKDNPLSQGRSEMVFNATSITDAVTKYRAIDMLMGRLFEMENKSEST